jgi:DNA-binding transcriptional ArsR family regulator
MEAPDQSGHYKKMESHNMTATAISAMETAFFAQSIPRNPEDIKRIAHILKAISHPTRLNILCVVSDGPLSISEIQERVGGTQSAISQHVEVMRTRGILVSRREGNRVLCSVSDPSVVELVGHMRKVFCPTKTN